MQAVDNELWKELWSLSVAKILENSGLEID